MTCTTFCLNPALKKRLLPLAFRDGDSYGIHPVVLDLDVAIDRVFLGGIGLYGTFGDFLKLTTHILQLKSNRAVPYRLLSPASVEALFEHTLEGGAESTWNSVTENYAPHLNCPAGAAQFSRGLFVNTVDIPGKRRAGSGNWGGWANTVYFIDPTAGISMVLATQLSPPGDDAFFRLYDQLEKEVYAAIGS